MSDPKDAARRASLIEYAPWVLRDYATNQGPSTAIVVLLIGYMTLLPIIAGVQSGEFAGLGDVPAPLAANMLRAIVAPLVFLGTFFATNGIIANDRKLGFYRFLFAKPVAPPTYYATTFAVYGVGLLAVTVAIMGIWSLAVRPMFPLELFAVVVLMYVAYGGIGFLLSAAWRFDWLSLVTVLLVANVAWSVWGTDPGFKRYVLYLLPPVHRSAEVYAMIANDTLRAVPWSSILWLGGYGLLCFAAGMIVVRRRPLGTS
jgi:hypothetical protein